MEQEMIPALLAYCERDIPATNAVMRSFDIFSFIGIDKLMTKQPRDPMASDWINYDARRMALKCGMTTIKEKYNN